MQVDQYPEENARRFKPRRVCASRDTHNYFKHCCEFVMWFKPDPSTNDKAIVPLRHVSFKGLVENGHAQLNAQMTFVNNLALDRAIECQFDFPVTPDITVTELFFTVGDKTIQAKI